MLALMDNARNVRARFKHRIVYEEQWHARNQPNLGFCGK
jgi:hypothetical protein